jgi:type II restriction enzyme
MKNGLKQFNYLIMDIYKELLKIGDSMGYRSWFANNETSKTTISLKNEKMISSFDDVIEEANYIDCIWFNGDKEISAFIKFSTAERIVESICRLKNIKELLPPYYTSYILIAPDTCLDKVFIELKKPIFKDFVVKLLPLSQIEKIQNLLINT